MRIVPPEESAAEEKLLDTWWAELDSMQKHSIYNATQDLKDTPEREHLCLVSYPTGEMGGPEGKNPIYTKCYETKPCEKHKI